MTPQNALEILIEAASTVALDMRNNEVLRQAIAVLRESMQKVEKPVGE